MKKKKRKNVDVNTINEKQQWFIKKYSTPLGTEETFSYYQLHNPQKINSEFNQLIKDFLSLPKQQQKNIIAYHNIMGYKGGYLITRYWLICRCKVLDRDKHLCRLFIKHSSEKLRVHHNTYIYFGNEIFHLECLITLCEDCHHLIEEYEKKNKANYNADNRLNELESIANGYSNNSYVPETQQEPVITETKTTIVVEANKTKRKINGRKVIKASEDKNTITINKKNIPVVNDKKANILAMTAKRMVDIFSRP